MWYKDGLKFKCTECGKCCTGPSGYVWVSIEEITGMAEILKISVEQFIIKYTRKKNNKYALIERKNLNGDFDCVFLKDKKCMVYQTRPQQCRTFPWWKENLNTEESWKLAARDCEGINENAPIVPYTQIVQLLRNNSEPD